MPGYLLERKSQISLGSINWRSWHKILKWYEGKTTSIWSSMTDDTNVNISQLKDKFTWCESFENLFCKKCVLVKPVEKFATIDFQGKRKWTGISSRPVPEQKETKTGTNRKCRSASLSRMSSDPLGLRCRELCSSWRIRSSRFRIRIGPGPSDE